MAWLDQIASLVKVLTRIADALDRAYPIRKVPTGKPAEIEDLIEFDPQAQYEREQAEEAREEMGELPPQPRGPRF